MKQLSLPFRLRPSLVVGALCLFINHAVAGADVSRVPQSSQLISTLLQQGVSSAPGLCFATDEQRPSLLAEVAAALTVASRAQAEPGFLTLNEFEAQSVAGTVLASTVVATIVSAQTTEAPVLKTNYSGTVVASATSVPTKPGKLGYLTGLPHELAEKAKTLSTHISEKFKVAPAHARYVVSSAMQIAGKTGLPPTLVLAVIAVESSFKATARNGNARGLMQIIPFWHKEKVNAVGGPEELMKVDKNIATGSAILKEYIERYGSVFQGLYRYNASSNAKEYSQKVLKQKSGFEEVLMSEP
jgi:hypothetical protein